MRGFYAAEVQDTTATDHGRWVGTRRWEQDGAGTMDLYEDGGHQNDGKDARPTEKIAVPEFGGDGNQDEVGMEARSYVRRVQVWLRVTKLSPRQRGLALYSALRGRAWVYSEELDSTSSRANMA
eukprot:s699_g25.t1